LPSHFVFVLRHWTQAWFAAVLPEVDTLEADTLEADALEADALEADALEADALEADALEADALEADALEADALEALGRTSTTRAGTGGGESSRLGGAGASLGNMLLCMAQTLRL
jgi:pentapeptide MXKDX repeat protein